MNSDICEFVTFISEVEEVDVRQLFVPVNRVEVGFPVWFWSGDPQIGCVAVQLV